MKKIFSRLIIAASAGLLALSGCKVFDSLESQDDEPISYAQISSDTLSGAYGLSARADYTLSLGNTTFSSKLIESSGDATANLSEYFSVALLSDSGEDVTDSLVDTENTKISALKAISSSSANIRVKLAVKENSASGDVSGTVQITAAKTATSSGEEVKCIMNSDAKFTLGHAGDEIASINNSSDKLTALYDIEAESPSAVLIFSGTPAAASTDAITLSIDSNKLMDSNGDTIDAVITSDANENARWNVASDAGYISTIEGAWQTGTGSGKEMKSSIPKHSMPAATNTTNPNSYNSQLDPIGTRYYINVEITNDTLNSNFASLGTSANVSSWIKDLPAGFSATIISSTKGSTAAANTQDGAKKFVMEIAGTSASDSVVMPKFICIHIKGEYTTSGKDLYATSPKYKIGVSPYITVNVNNGSSVPTLDSTSGAVSYDVTLNGDTFAQCENKEIYVATMKKDDTKTYRSELDNTKYPRPYAILNSTAGSSTGKITIYPQYLAVTDVLSGTDSNIESVSGSVDAGTYSVCIFLPEGSTQKYPLSTPNNTKSFMEKGTRFYWTASSGMATYAPTETQIASDGITVSASATECLAGSSVTLTAAPTSKYIDKTLLTYQWTITSGSGYATLENATSASCTLTVNADAPSGEAITVECTATYNYGGTESTATGSTNVTTKTSVSVNAKWDFSLTTCREYQDANGSGTLSSTPLSLTDATFKSVKIDDNATAGTDATLSITGGASISSSYLVGKKSISTLMYGSSNIPYAKLVLEADATVEITGTSQNTTETFRVITICKSWPKNGTVFTDDDVGDDKEILTYANLNTNIIITKSLQKGTYYIGFHGSKIRMITATSEAN